MIANFQVKFNRYFATINTKEEKYVNSLSDVLTSVLLEDMYSM